MPSAGRRRRARLLVGGVLLAVVVVAVLVVCSGRASADVQPMRAGHLVSAAPEDITKTADLPQVIENATDWITGISAVVATFFLTLGGFRYMFSNGEPGEVEKAKGSLRNAGFGYALALLAPVILRILQSVLGLKAGVPA